MKLQTKYSRAIITATICALILGSVGYYFLLRYILISQVDDALQVEEQEITDYIRTHRNLPGQTHYRDQQIQFIASGDQNRKFQTTALRDSAGNTQVSRQLLFPVTVNGKNYTAIVTKSQGETEQLFILILSVTGAVILLLLFFLFVSNRMMLKKIWKPFDASLGAMKQFKLEQPEPVALQKSNIDEFRDLNAALAEMTRKVVMDYQSLKAFADNASHEMQTPLAIINTKLDLLIQDQQLTERNMHHLQSIYDCVEKLTKLNQSLLLIAKIENHQFNDTKQLRMDAILNDRLSNLEELIHTRQLTVTTDLNACEISMNPMLADILVNNLLSNAIRHSAQSGNIKIESGERYFSISNTSNDHELDKNIIFGRFHKSAGSGGLGIGLAIVKQICDLYKFSINYTFSKKMHAFRVAF